MYWFYRATETHTRLMAASTKMNTCKLYVLVFYRCITNYHKLKSKIIISSQFCRSEVRPSEAELSAQGIIRLKSKRWEDWLHPHLEALGRKPYPICWQNPGPWVCRTEVLFPCWLSAEGHPQLLETTFQSLHVDPCIVKPPRMQQGSLALQIWRALLLPTGENSCF